MATYFVSCKNTTPGNGTRENPFQTIGQAAAIARAGDIVEIGGGVYREWVDPVYGGTSARSPILYCAKEGETPVISGAEIVTGWTPAGNGVWTTQIDSRRFAGHNPFDELIYGDWFDCFGKTHHTAEVYLDGEALYEAETVEELAAAEKRSWHAKVDPDSTTVWANFGGANPNEHLTEVNARAYCFFPSREAVNYITLSGLCFCQAASQWAPPTAFQPAAVGTHWSKGWEIKNCVIHDSKCCGISIGKRRDACDNDWVRNGHKGGAQTYTEIVMRNLKRDWNREYVGSHNIHDNHIYQCGQAGIVGNMGCIYSTIRNNHIHHINVRGEFGGAEMAGIKLHSAIDAHIEGNCIHHCVRGLWLDWQAQGARVSRNAFFENVQQDLFIEVCHGPCVVDNNLLLSPVSFLCVSQGSALVHNLFAGVLKLERETSRFSLYHFPHDTFVAGSMIIYGGDDRLIGNIFVGNASGTSGYNGYRSIQEREIRQVDDRPYSYEDATLPVDIHDNLYLGGACSCEREQNARAAANPIHLRVQQRDDGWVLLTDLYQKAPEACIPVITTEQLGKAYESDQWFDNPDESPLRVDVDYAGAIRDTLKTPVGPLAAGAEEIWLWPSGMTPANTETEGVK